MTPRPRIIAHRGASLEMPENTLLAYQRAIDLGADAIELDVHLTHDGKVVCHHDETLKGPKPLRIAEHALKDLRRQFSEIPTLAEVLQLPFGSTGLMIELKGTHIALVKAVWEQLQDHALPSLILGSFSLEIMRGLQRHWPRQQLVGIADDAQALGAHAALRPGTLAIHIALATPKHVQRLLTEGFEICVWTIDDIASARAVCACGVQGIITNDPRLLLAELGNLST
jgi:glycerophosphoryl diester phosphodiesterase